MLFSLFHSFGDQIPVLNVFRYLTFRTGGAVVTALLVVLIFGEPLIAWLKARQGNGQPIRDDGPQQHLISKVGTPTMGGVLILLGLMIATLLWTDLSNPYVWVALLGTAGFGCVGFADDYMKVTKADSRGVPGRIKLVVEIAIAIAIGWAVASISPDAMSGKLALPFFKNILIDLGWFFLPFMVCVIVGSSNAVNLTDGLDGLAIVPVIIAASTFAFIAYLVGNAVFAEYLQLHAIPGAGELAVFCGAILGAGLGFLWFNAPPAMVFMGDTGSLALGAALGIVGVVTKHELVLAVVGGLFVLETVSVIVQVASFKLTGNRIFRMAPLHHHFEQKGWAESTIVIRFWIISVILALLGLATLKLR